MTEWVRVRNPKSGGEAVVARKSLRLMPKWKEVKAKKATARRSESSANQSSGSEPENPNGEHAPADGEE